MKYAMVTVVGKDRPGIIAEVTGLLFQAHCNLEDISMTVLEGQFAMLMVVDFGTSEKYAAAVKRLKKAEKASKLTFFLKDLKTKPARGEKHARNSNSYLISVMGNDRTGIVHATSRILARHAINITDLNSKILGRGRKAIYAMLLEVDIPKKFPIVKIEKEFEGLSRKLKVEARLKPLERIEL